MLCNAKNAEKHAGHECNRHLKHFYIEKQWKSHTVDCKKHILCERTLSVCITFISFEQYYFLAELFLKLLVFFIKAIAHHWVVILNINIQMKDTV